MKTKKIACQATLDDDGRIFSQKFDEDTRISEFRQMVLDYYSRHGRPMPWRDTTDPYKILVSEIMLQQTQVERVLVKYPAFLSAFPDFSTLAQAPLADILTVWQGMGYNRRAISLQKCAQRVVNEYNGILPADVETLATFPGIGRATASSICAFAFNMPVVFIETNIRRVFIHFFFSDADRVNDTEILPLVEKALFNDNPRVWYWALMDLGTALKKIIANPNRKSAHYTKQAPFEGSDRRIRGRIIALLLATPNLTMDEIAATFTEDPDRILRIVKALESEEFIRCSKNHYSVAS
ncbi:MAG: A/G-specific adenine glycosylase [Methanoregula sp.]